MNREPKRSKVINILLLIIFVGSSLLYYVALSPQRFGRGHDDTVYLTTAKALATGGGYRIISLPYQPAQTKYPPFYPLLLSVVWRLYPSFPENLPWMMLLSSAAAVGFLALSYKYLVEHQYSLPWQALLAVGLAAVNWRLVTLATSVYSEMVYGLLSVAALYLAEKYEKQKDGVIGVAAMSCIAGLTFLTRSVGVSLIAAVFVYYAMRKKWGKALLVAGIGSVFVIGWFLWCHINRTTFEGINVAYYTDYWRDLSETVTGMQNTSHMPRFLVFANVIGRNAILLILLSIPVVCLGISYDAVLYFGFAFIFIAAGFIRQIRKGIRLLHIYIILFLLLTLPIPGSYDRYLMPLLPFLLLYFVTEVGVLVSLVRKQVSEGQIGNRISAGLIGAALVIAIVIAGYNYASETYWRLHASSLRKTARPAKEDAEVLRWIGESTNPTDVLISYRDLLYYLYTGRKGAQSVFFRYGGYIPTDKQTLDERVKEILRIIDESNAGYLITNPSDFDSEFSPPLQRETLKNFIELHPEIFVPVFRSSDLSSVVYRVEIVNWPSVNPNRVKSLSGIMK
jgi:hypothetical protein